MDVLKIICWERFLNELSEITTFAYVHQTIFAFLISSKKSTYFIEFLQNFWKVVT